MTPVAPFFQRAYAPLSRIWHLAADEWSTKQVAFRARIECWRHGFLSRSQGLYDWQSFPIAEFVSDWERYMLAPRINGRHAAILNDKGLFRRTFEAALPLPRLVGIRRRGLLVDGTGAGVAEPTILERERAFVAKPLCGGGGRRIRLFEKRSTGWHVNGQFRPAQQVLAALGDGTDSIFETKVENGAYAHAIFPTALNTVRVLTLIDPADGRAFVARAFHRFGTSRSAPVDNFAQGGMCVAVDLATGELGRGACPPADGPLQWRERHPDTGATIAGVAIPRWNEIKAALADAANGHPELPYIGWDVAVGEDRFVVIEGNANTALEAFQIHEPMLRNPRIKGFYECHHALARWR